MKPVCDVNVAHIYPLFLLFSNRHSYLFQIAKVNLEIYIFLGDAKTVLQQIFSKILKLTVFISKIFLKIQKYTLLFVFVRITNLKFTIMFANTEREN